MTLIFLKVANRWRWTDQIANLRHIAMGYLHDGDGGDGGIGEWVFVSQRAGVGGTLAETDFQGVHQTAEQLDQLWSSKNQKKKKRKQKTVESIVNFTEIEVNWAIFWRIFENREIV